MTPTDEHQPTEVDPTRSHSRVPKKIGRYTIQGVIATGGMGTVFKAVQENPRRAVAVKVMRTGMSSVTALRRFEFEAQLLGRLRHPGIAQIYEAGTHDDDGERVPFFAMEYIPNPKDIQSYAEEKKLGTRERLELFFQVAQAVHHGHQKGIIHRDLKPGNILVGPDGNPRIIDFGVARATDSDMALTLQQTDVGQLVGTVQYMSPEQCQADPHDIDTRSDVYALGVVLYQLLCGRLPYALKDKSIFEVTRIIQDQDPVKPSTIDRKLRGDLETIVLKALEKDRDRRYQSAIELAQDVERYLSGNTISAHPASAMYQLRVFVKRNKGPLAAISAVGLVLAAGIVISTVLFLRGQSDRLLAQQQTEKALTAETYLQDIMAGIDPTNLGDQVSISQLLNSFGDEIEERFAGQPEVEATVRFSLARSYIFLSLIHGGKSSKKYAWMAERHLEKVLDYRRESLGESHPQTLETMEAMAIFLVHSNAVEAEKLRREALRIREANAKGAGDPEVLEARKGLASVLSRQGKFSAAEKLTREVFNFRREANGEEDPSTLSAKSELAWLLEAQGQLAEAEAMRVDLLDTVRRRGGDPEDEVSALAALAHVYVAQGKLADARDIYQESYSMTAEDIGIKEWLVPGEPIDPDDPTVLLFWEAWCPYSQSFIPRVHDLYVYTQEEGSPVQVIGLTALSKKVTKKFAKGFIDRNKLTFPNAVYEGQLMDDLGFAEVPKAAVFHQSQVVWKGHISQITPEFLAGLAGRTDANAP